MCHFLHPLKSSNFDPRTYLRHLWANISKKNFRVPGRTGHRDIDPQNPENARNQAQKNQCSRTDLIKIWDACDLKMTPILHFLNKIFVIFNNKVVRRSYRSVKIFSEFLLNTTLFLKITKILF